MNVKHGTSAVHIVAKSSKLAKFPLHRLLSKYKASERNPKKNEEWNNMAGQKGTVTEQAQTLEIIFFFSECL